MKTGQAIVEIVIAFAVATIAVLAMVQVATKSLSNAGAAKRAAQATAYAMEGMEWVTGQRDLNTWSIFTGKSGNYCISLLPADWLAMTITGTCGGVVISGTEFSRYVNLTPSGNRDAVTVTVSWYEGSRLTDESTSSEFTAY